VTHLPTLVPRQFTVYYVVPPSVIAVILHIVRVTDEHAGQGWYEDKVDIAWQELSFPGSNTCCE